MRALGLLTAIPEEFDQLSGRVDAGRTDVIGGVAFLTGRMDGLPVVLAQSGIGKVNAAFAATVLLDRCQCRGIVFSGVAGSLSPSVHVGDVIVARRLVQHDYGALADRVFWPAEPGSIPRPDAGAKHAGYRLAPDLEQRLVDVVRTVSLPVAPGGDAGRPPAIRFGTVVTGDVFLNCHQTRADLQRLHDADAIEMEGAAVAQIAHRFGVPCVVIRTISDEASGGSHVDFAAFARVVAANAAALTPSVVRALTPSEAFSAGAR